MSLLRLGFAFLGFFPGALFGGLVHLLLLYRVALAAVRHSGLNPLYWGVKPIGENFLALFILYGFPLCGVLLLTVVYGLIALGTIFARMLGIVPHSARYPWPLPNWSLLSGVFLGAVCACGANWRSVTGEYAAQLACGERYAVATAATALRAMNTLTAAYCGALLALFAGGALVQRVWLVRHPA